MSTGALLLDLAGQVLEEDPFFRLQAKTFITQMNVKITISFFVRGTMVRPVYVRAYWRRQGGRKVYVRAHRRFRRPSTK